MYPTTPPSYHDQAYRVTQALDAAHKHRNEIAEQLADLKQRLFYQAIPRQVWEPRTEGGEEYLYLIFPQNRYSSTYTGPDGKRKLYVGRDQERIKDVREAIKRTGLIAQLEDELSEADSLIANAQNYLAESVRVSQAMLRRLHLSPESHIPNF